MPRKPPSKEDSGRPKNEISLMGDNLVVLKERRNVLAGSTLGFLLGLLVITSFISNFKEPRQVPIASSDGNKVVADKAPNGGLQNGIVTITGILCVAALFFTGVLRFEFPTNGNRFSGVCSLLCFLLLSILVLVSLVTNTSGGIIAFSTNASFTVGLSTIAADPLALLASISFIAACLILLFPRGKPHPGVLSSLLFGSLISSCLLSTSPTDANARLYAPFVALIPFALLAAYRWFIQGRPFFILGGYFAAAASVAVLGHRDASLLFFTTAMVAGAHLNPGSSVSLRVVPGLALALCLGYFNE